MTSLGIPLLFLSLVLPAAPCAARSVTVTGILYSGFDISERQFHDEDDIQASLTRPRDDGDAQQFMVSPMISVQSSGVRDVVELQYAPVAKYDLVPDEADLDHHLKLSAKGSPTQNWSYTLEDQFEYTDNPTRSLFFRPAGTTTAPSIASTELPRDEISTDFRRERFYTNDASIRSDHAFAPESSVGAGYANRILRKDSSAGSYSEFDRHELTLGGKWKPGQEWLLGLTGWYVIGDYAPATDTNNANEDLHEYRTRASVAYSPDTLNTFPVTYDFISTDYDGTRADSRFHELLLGWERLLHEDLRFYVGAGPAYYEIDGQDSTWGYSGYLGLEKRWPFGVLALRAEKRLETNNFTGTNDNGITDTYAGRVEYTHHLTERLDGNLFFIFRDEKRLDPQGVFASVDENGVAVGDREYHKQRYEIGAGLSYRFRERYLLSTSYAYARQDADLSDDSYDEHLFRMMLSVEIPWGRW